MITSTISSKGQVTIPKQIRELLKVGTSDKIVFIPLEDGKVLITTKQVPASDTLMLRAESQDLVRNVFKPSS